MGISFPTAEFNQDALDAAEFPGVHQFVLPPSQCILLSRGRNVSFFADTFHLFAANDDW